MHCGRWRTDKEEEYEQLVFLVHIDAGAPCHYPGGKSKTAQTGNGIKTEQT